MDTTRETTIRACQDHLARFFRSYRDANLQESAEKALRFLAASDVPMKGKPAGWAAGIIYFLANRGQRACGVPGLLNSELEAFFAVSMSTVRKRAVQVERVLEM